MCFSYCTESVTEIQNKCHTNSKQRMPVESRNHKKVGFRSLGSIGTDYFPLLSCTPLSKNIKYQPEKISSDRNFIQQKLMSLKFKSKINSPSTHY